jgi:pimeloyl-ACP methyl ester carboxylesterase
MARGLQWITDRWNDASREGTTAIGAGLALTAGLLGGLWVDGQRRKLQAERDHPPKGRFLDADGTRIHVLEQGRGSDVVFLHGNGTMAEDMALALFDRAGESWHAVAFDRPGFGYSERPSKASSMQGQVAILRAAAKAMGLRRPVLVGHSWGAPAALAWALEAPGEVGGVVVLSGWYFPTTRPDFMPMMGPAVPVLGDILAGTVLQPVDRLLLPNLLSRIFEPNPISPSFQRMPFELMLRPSQIKAAAEDTASLIPGVAGMAPRYGTLASMPVAILAGEADRIVDPYDHSVALHKAVPGSTIHLLADTGHMMHHVRPEAVLAAVADVVRQAGFAAAEQSDRLATAERAGDIE